jgi:hypothetical protein
MENIGTGAGLAAIGFWLFVAIVVLGGIWDSARKREAQHETLRRMMESDKPIDPQVMDEVLSITGKSGADSKDLIASLKLAGVLMLFIAPGLLLLGWATGAFIPLLGVSGLVLCIAVGLLVAANTVARWYAKESA